MIDGISFYKDEERILKKYCDVVYNLYDFVVYLL